MALSLKHLRKPHVELEDKPEVIAAKEREERIKKRKETITQQRETKPNNKKDMYRVYPKGSTKHI